MTSPILFAGGEDLNYTVNGGSLATSTPSQNGVGIDNTAGRFRAGYARYGIAFVNDPSQGLALNTLFMRTAPAFSSATFWTTARIYVGAGSANNSSAQFIRFADSTGVVRLRARLNASTLPSTIVLEKVNAAGSVTTLVTSSLSFGARGSIDKLDVYINYAVSGTFTLYFNGVVIATYSGDVTTDSQTALSAVDFLCAQTNSSATVPTVWSEVIVSTRDTRNFSLVTQAATANGNTHNWDSGTAANISASSMVTGQTTPNYSGSAGQIQEYQVTPAIPSGSFSVISVVQTAQATVGTSGPTKFEFMVRAGSTDYTSTPDAAPGVAWSTFSYNWDTNPNTSVPWLTSDLPASSTSFNYGLKSVT